jgi:hypothetical protein
MKVILVEAPALLARATRSFASVTEGLTAASLGQQKYASITEVGVKLHCPLGSKRA